MPRSYSKKSLAHKMRRCHWCGKTGNGDEFCDLPEDDNKWACLECDDEMINCAKCGDCPTMFYKDAVEIGNCWYCKECATPKEDICVGCGQKAKVTINRDGDEMCQGCYEYDSEEE